MAKRNSPGGRSRKRRSRGHSAPQSGAPEPRAGAQPSQRTVAADARAPRARAARAPRAGSQRDAGESRAPGGFGPRPQAPWHPLPLSELLILVGMIATVVGVARGESGLPVLFAGIGSVAIGTIDFSIREHLSGYRSHTTLLAALPTALLHAGVAFAMFSLGAPSPTWVIAPLLLDVPLFATLFKLFRARFLDARRERVFAAGR